MGLQAFSPGQTLAVKQTQVVKFPGGSATIPKGARVCVVSVTKSSVTLRTIRTGTSVVFTLSLSSNRKYIKW